MGQLNSIELVDDLDPIYKIRAKKLIVELSKAIIANNPDTTQEQAEKMASFMMYNNYD